MNRPDIFAQFELLINQAVQQYTFCLTNNYLQEAVQVASQVVAAIEQIERETPIPDRNLKIYLEIIQQKPIWQNAVNSLATSIQQQSVQLVYDPPYDGRMPQRKRMSFAERQTPVADLERNYHQSIHQGDYESALVYASQIAGNYQQLIAANPNRRYSQAIQDRLNYWNNNISALNNRTQSIKPWWKIL